MKTEHGAVHGGRHFGSVLYRPAALADLDRIHDTTAEMWGLAQAEHYLSQLRAAVERVVQHPHSGRVYDAAATRLLNRAKLRRVAAPSLAPEPRRQHRAGAYHREEAAAQVRRLRPKPTYVLTDRRAGYPMPRPNEP